MKKLFLRLAGYTDNPYFSLVFMAVLLAFSFSIGFFKIATYDVWWHLKTGELILESGIPSTDPFSFTAYGRHWVAHEWLAEVVLFLIYKLGGITALIAFKGLISAAVAYVLFQIGRRGGVFAPLSAAMALFAVAGLSYMMYARPHAFSFLFLAIELYLLFRVARTPKDFFWERWVILPAILLVWANMHAGFILGLGVCWVVAARELFIPYTRELKFMGRFKRVIIPAILGTLICLVNPNGYEIFTYPLLIAANPVFKSSISEWVSPLFLGPEEWLAKYFLYLATALGVLAMIKHIRRRPEISVVVLVVGISAWFAMRNIQNYAIVLAAALLAGPVVAAPKSQSVVSRLQPVLSVLALAWMIAWFSMVRGYQDDNGRLGLGIKKGLAPIEAAEFLNKVDFQGNIINILADGGYLIWAGYPRWKVFVDGRLDVYGEEQITNYRRIIEGHDGFTTIDELKVDAAVLPMPPSLGSLRKLMAQSPDWALTHFDDYYLVYLKRTPRNQPIIDRWGYSFIDPLATGYGLTDLANLDGFLAEAERAIKNLPGSALANVVYGQALQYKGDHARATGHFKAAVEAHPGRLALYKSVAESFARAGAYDSAKVWFNIVRERQPNDPSPYFSLGMISAMQKDYGTAEKYFNEVLKIDPANGSARDMIEKIRAVKEQQNK